MTFKPGDTKPKASGRKKGSINKTTAELKEMILEAANRAGKDENGKGGTIEYLTAQANTNPAAFMSLLGKVLPKDINVRRDPIEDMTDDQLRQLIARLDQQLGPYLAIAAESTTDGEAERATRH